MNKSFIFIFVLLFSFTSMGQFEENNKWSLDLGGGFTNAVKPYTTGYFSNTYDLFHVSGGLRYMFNNKYGIKFDGGYDRITNGSSGEILSNEFQTNYYRASFQGIADIGRLLMFENFTNHVSLLFHSGLGFSMLQSDLSFDGSNENMVNFMFGFTPQIKLGKRVALFADASFIWHIYQQKKFDMTNSHSKRGFDSFLANASIGFNIYLGKHEQHMDWAYSPCFPDMSYLENEIKKLDSANVVLQKKFQDDDGDGVINFLDQEKNTPYGAIVDCDGKEKGADSTNLAVVPAPTPDVNPEPDVVPDSSPTTIEPGVTPTPTLDGTTTPTPDVTPVPTPDGTTTPTPDGTPVPTPDGTTTPTPGGTPVPTPDGTPTPTPDVTPTPTPDGTPSPTPDGTPAPTPDGTPTPTLDGTPTPTPDGTPTPTPDVTPTPTPDVTPTPTPDGTTTPTPDGTTTPTPDGTPTPAPDGTTTPVPDGTTTPAPDGTITPVPDGTTTPAPDVTPASDATPTPTPTTDGTSAPSPDVTPTPTPDISPMPLPVIDKAGLTSIGDINFSINQSLIQSKFYPVLNETASLLKSIPGSSIIIAGHTDITGDNSFNQKLALKRANSIKNYLIGRGVNANLIEVVSFGEMKPKFLNITAAGRALNRRVEVYIK